MSNNAVEAYQSDQRPRSKWSKHDIIIKVEELAGAERAAELKKLTLEELKEGVLAYAGCHHTSKFYNRTEFYEVDVDLVAEVDVETIIKMRRSKAKSRCSAPELRRARVKYTVWSGTRRFSKATTYEEVVQIPSDGVMVKTVHGGKKRQSSLTILEWL